MRMSAIICRCSLSTANARGADASASASATSTRGMRRRIIRTFSLGGDDEMGAPVLRPRGLLVTRIEGEFLPVADRPQPVRRNPQRHQVGARAPRPPPPPPPPNT